MVANMMMTLAQWLTPRAQTAWFAAMQGEYAALTRGRSGWALGCLGAAAGWRLQADGVWLLIVSVAFPFLREVFMTPWFFLTASWPVKGWLWYVFASVPDICVWVVIGLLWPRRIFSSSVLSVVAQLIAIYITFWTRMDMPLTGYVNHNDLPPVIGEASLYLTAFLSLWLGAGLRATALRLVQRSK